MSNKNNKDKNNKNKNNKDKNNKNKNNKDKNNKNKNNKDTDNINNIIYNKYIDIYNKNKNILNKYKNKNIINNKEINNLIINEINTLQELIKNKNIKYNLYKIDGKPILIYVNYNDNLYTFFTTIAMSIIVNRIHKDINKFINNIKDSNIITYKKENRLFIKIINKNNNQHISDKRLNIYNFKQLQRLNKEIGLIFNAFTKDKKIKNNNKKDKKIEIVEI